MPISNPCFVSYPHPRVEGSFLATFVEDLVHEVGSQLDGFVPGTVAWDKPRLKPTYHFTEALRQDICQSICMVVVYCPEYAQRDYCRREFDLMERIDLKRRAALGAKAGKHHFIALVSLAPLKDLPPKLAETAWHVADFSAYRTLPQVGKRRIRRSPALREEVRLLAEAIDELHRMTQGAPGFGEPALCCGETFAAPEAVPAWSATPYPR